MKLKGEKAWRNWVTGQGTKARVQRMEHRESTILRITSKGRAAGELCLFTEHWPGAALGLTSDTWGSGGHKDPHGRSFKRIQIPPKRQVGYYSKTCSCDEETSKSESRHCMISILLNFKYVSYGPEWGLSWGLFHRSLRKWCTLLGFNALVYRRPLDPVDLWCWVQLCWRKEGREKGRKKETSWGRQMGPDGRGQHLQLEDISQQIQTLMVLWRSKVTSYK